MSYTDIVHSHHIADLIGTSNLQTGALPHIGGKAVHLVEEFAELSTVGLGADEAIIPVGHGVEWSVLGWFKKITDTGGDSPLTIDITGHDSGNAVTIIFNWNNGKLNIRNDVTSTNNFFDGAVPSAGWCYFAIRMRNNNLSVFSIAAGAGNPDGSQDNTVAMDIFPDAELATFAMRAFAGNSGIDIALDEVSLWSIGLSDAQVRIPYNNGIGTNWAEIVAGGGM